MSLRRNAIAQIEGLGFRRRSSGAPPTDTYPLDINIRTNENAVSLLLFIVVVYCLLFTYVVVVYSHHLMRMISVVTVKRRLSSMGTSLVIYVR
jgi:hypothetical protein